MSCDFDELYNEYKTIIEQKLESCPVCVDSRLRNAMRYSLLSGGKRLRPVLVLEFCRVSGKNPADALDFAAAVEMLHVYSLIHDDLPCMDNDDFRRGKPSNHKAYGEWLALLAGDALHTEAFSVILNADLPCETRLAASSALSHAVGCNGMCAGQYLDMNAQGTALSIQELETMCVNKTGALIAASCRIGCIAADAGTEKEHAAEQYGKFLAMAFQIRDDVLDYEGSFEKLGKLIGSDSKNMKSTFVSALGIHGCAERIKAETRSAKGAISGMFEDTSFLYELADRLAFREN